MTHTSTTLPINIRHKNGGHTFVVEIDRDRLERLAADLGFFRPEFLKSLERAEREVAQRKTRRLQSLRSLRRHG